MTDVQSSARIQWEDPPPTERRRVGAKRQALDENPGKWMLWAKTATSSAASYLRNKGYETVTRSNHDGSFRVYARKPAEQTVKVRKRTTSTK